jgi:peptide-methionine (S)-S-oxide reductase
MPRPIVGRSLRAVALGSAFIACTVPAAIAEAQRPAPPAVARRDTAVFAGGCFWGIEAVYRHTRGVISAVSGYAGGDARTAQYETVSDGNTGHAESVRVIFDPAQVTYAQLLMVLFTVAHDPTQLNRQGPDVGTQYRSSVFYRNDDQKRIVDEYIAQLTAQKAFSRAIVTKVVPLKAFYPAEPYHQNYAALHPNEPYIYYNDAPKVVHLKERMPQLYREDGGN